MLSAFVAFGRRLSALSCRALLLAVLATLVLASSLSAQTPGATISGAVTDESGAVVPNVELTLGDAARGVQRRAVSNEQGAYTFVGVPPGTYVLLAVGQGFASQQIEGITLANGDRRSLVVSLKVGSVAERVSVTAPGGYTTNAVTIGKTAHSLREIPQSVTVITRQRLDDQNLRNLDEALAQSTGITISGHPTNPSLFSRGFQISTVQRDGVPLDIGNPFFVQPDMSVYERVEVLRGAAGLFSGVGQPGGAVNLVRKRALATADANAAMFAGSWNNYRVEADVTGGLNASRTLRGRLVATYQNRGYFFNADDSQSSVVYGRLEYNVAPNTVVSGGGLFERRDGLPYTNGLPFYPDGGSVGLPRSTFLAAEWSRWDFSKPEVFVEVEHRFNPSWRTRIAWSQVRENSDYKTATEWGAVDPVTNLTARPIDGAGIEQRRSHQNGIDVTLTGRFEAFGHDHEVVVGANHLGTDGDLKSAYPALGPYPLDAFQFDPRSIPEPETPSWEYEFRSKVRQTGYYTMLRLTPLTRLTLAAGARWSNWELTERNLLAGTTTQDYNASDEVTPYGALTYDLSEHVSLYTSYADVFQAQRSYTFDGQLLPPIVGANYEGGLKGEWSGGAISASVAYFYITQANRAQPDPEHPSPCAGSPTGGCSIAEGEVRSQGMDWELTGRLSANLDLYAGYTYNTTEYLRDRTATGAPSANEGQPFQTFVPRHIARMWANYRVPSLSSLSMGTGVTAQSSQYRTSGVVEVRQGAYALWNARLSYDVGSRWSLSLNANNLLDTTYYRALSNVNYANHYGDPRSVTLTLRVR